MENRLPLRPEVIERLSREINPAPLTPEDERFLREMFGALSPR